MAPSILITESIHEDALDLLRAGGCIVRMAPCGEVMTPADALLIRTQPLGEAEAALFGLISKHGVGVDNIPLDAVREAGGWVMNTPGANSAAVSEQALMLMLALARNLRGQELAQREGRDPPRSPGLEGRRLLVVGFGGSGQRLALLGQTLGMKVRVLSRRTDPAAKAGFAVATDPDEAMAEADIVSLHCPLTDATRNFLSAERLALLPKGAFVVNCARGGLIDEVALAENLRSGHLGGAGLDVTLTEPLPSSHPLHGAPRLILTPHAAAMSEGAFRRMGMMAAQNILDHFAGCPDPSHVVLSGRPTHP
ncbi:MAG: NAD(P)-dependent oxidoreductase [Pseudorhodobacter sp.]